ncbi:MAG: hypothetical protein RMK29_18855 [Myxococcales bacterium]|nr:hypothetical protein [Myxococcota bacterium]MDW8283768.1 hypothetical protein [Myxococcales bacterium]
MRRMVSALLLVACTIDNPEYRPGPPRTDGLEEIDLRAASDGGDFVPPSPTTCSDGDRRCRLGEGGRWLSQHCQQGEWRDDRLCPEGSACASGYCQPPPRRGPFEGRTCGRENDCFDPQQPRNATHSCQPFVRPQDRQVQGFCAVQISPPGTGFPGTICLPQEGWVCRSGFCDEVSRRADGWDRHYCFRACMVDGDCPSVARYCREALITVEGVSYSARSCVPVP